MTLRVVNDKHLIFFIVAPHNEGKRIAKFKIAKMEKILSSLENDFLTQSPFSYKEHPTYQSLIYDNLIILDTFLKFI